MQSPDQKTVESDLVESSLQPDTAQQNLARFAEVFFPTTGWSARYGEKFFTASVTEADVEDKEKGKEHAVYTVTCRLVHS